MKLLVKYKIYDRGRYRSRTDILNNIKFIVSSKAYQSDTLEVSTKLVLENELKLFGLLINLMKGTK